MIFWIVLLLFWGSAFLYFTSRFLMKKSLSKKEIIFLIVSNFLTAIFFNEIFGSQFLTYLLGIY